MDTRFFISGAAMRVLSFALGFVLHGVLLGADYTPLAGTLYPHPR
jgi:hypothetical protein